MQTVTLGAASVTDTMIISASPDTNYGTDTTISVGELTGTTSLRRTLIKFDLTAYTGRRVISAVVRIYDSTDDYTNNARTMNIFRVRRAWTEAGATWNKYDGSNNWTTAGAADTTNDIYAGVVGSISLPNPPVEGYKDITIGTDYINTWLNGSVTNNGFLLSMDTGLDDAHVFFSSEYDSGSRTPQLVLTFSGGGPIISV